ncbi:hypothetical protein LOK49_LG14G01729 [Camellia lanceoleosa]|uniref:Uncharacterized protein n=1 Tax=Camellia lanceoleosa TaxID=1840588 RepID=A0ACC0F7U3_9ERIC|nr:hypothetical protein LOK49_LG14G01729 [Camellia lanceoleosa]
MAATATATEAPRIWSSVKPRRRPNPTVERSSIPARIGICNPIPFLSTSFKTSSYSFIVRASEERQTQEAANSGSNDPDRAFISQEDVSYLWKLGVGSIVGAAVIKYGSVIFPEITRPDILVALIMIFTPVIIAVLLLIRQSRLQQ